MGRAAELEAARAAPGPPSEPTGNLLALAGNTTDGVAICRGGLIRWANAQLAQITGCASPQTLIGKPIEELLVRSGVGLPGPESDRIVECQVRTSGGLVRRVRARCCPGETRGGEAEEIWTIQDVTQLRRAEEELLRVSLSLAAVNREAAELRARLRGEAEEREELLTVVSHELRTPVTVISGYNRLLLSGETGSLSHEQRCFLRESTKSCQRLNAFIGNLLEASRELRGEDALDLKEASLEPSIAGVVSFMRPLLEEHELGVEIALDPEASVARFDAVRIEQVLTNLLGNAIKYARRGSEIRVSSARIEAAGLRFVEVSVSDQGPGVSAEDRERIFEPYVRAGEESRAGGLGLGLAICKRIVESHGGSIAVTDRPDSAAGSRFSFTLPAGSPGDACGKRKES